MTHRLVVRTDARTGQTSGVAVASAVFQYRLDTELHRRIHGPNAEKVRASCFARVG